MAVRSTKISRDVISSCKQFVAHKSDITSVSSNRTQISTSSGDETTSYGDEDNTSSIRYIVTNTNRPKILPKIEFPKNPEQLIPPEMRHLQPAMLPKFMELREDPENTKWEIRENVGRTMDCPFPEPIKELRTETITVSDQKKAELKMPNSIRVRFGNMNTINRNFCTSPFWIPSRSMGSHKTKKSNGGNYNSRAHCDAEADKGKIGCDPARKKSSGCPRFILNECAQTKGSDCVHHYIDPRCKKKNAPYPSYSESCAERLEEDPSECMQCPWQKCGGVEAIKPQRRKYHMASTELNPNQISSSITPLYSPAILDLDFNCDSRKEPCKRPVGKCKQEEYKRDRERAWKEDRRVEKSRYIHKDKNQHKFAIIDGLYASKNDNRRGKLPFDKNLGDYDYIRKRKCSIDKSKCERKKRKIVPDPCYSDDCKKCNQTTEIEDYLLSSQNYECKSNKPKNDCPPIKITPIPTDSSLDDSFKPDDPCCQEAKKGVKLTDKKKRKRRNEHNSKKN